MTTYMKWIKEDGMLKYIYFNTNLKVIGGICLAKDVLNLNPTFKIMENNGEKLI